MSRLQTAGATGEDARLVEALRAGDEAAFRELVARHHASLVRLALVFVRSRAVAEEVAQETWLALLEGLERFEGRSSLKTWLFRILTNIAKTRAQRERRTVPFSALADESDEPAVDPGRFLDASHPIFPGHWASPPRNWEELPEERLLGKETLDQIREAIEALPPAQRSVIALRDVEGWTSDEVRSVLDISETNQRVLLHRARSKVRAALENYLDKER
jgi:RNA polymerase sigma-70 factor (ECF subfamily)